MGRECRKVPSTWIHPKDSNGLIPLRGSSYAEAKKRWDEGDIKWKEGLRQDWDTKEWIPHCEDCTFSEWDGDSPVESEYMPDWSQDECTHYQMYETCTEGTPISPVFSTPEECARWCANNGASAFGSQIADYDFWLKIAKGGGSSGLICGPGIPLQPEVH